jgi:putative membrane protein
VNRTAAALLLGGSLLFIGILVSEGLPAVLDTLSHAGWGLGLVAAFHLLPLLLDALAISTLFPVAARAATLRDAALARWIGESANSLLPAGQIGGPVLMTRFLSQRGMALPDAAAAITVSTTLQTAGQITFALLGVALIGARAGRVTPGALMTSAVIASVLLALQVAGFYFLQRRGLFGRVMRTLQRLASRRDWSSWVTHAESIDAAVAAAYARGLRVCGSFALSFIAWLVGAGEVYLILALFHCHISAIDAVILESLGQAIRGAGFAVPGALGVQEAGYVLLAPLAGLTGDAALALALAKRSRELLLGAPGLLYLHWYGRVRPGLGASSL